MTRRRPREFDTNEWQRLCGSIKEVNKALHDLPDDHDISIVVRTGVHVQLGLVIGQKHSGVHYIPGLNEHEVALLTTLEKEDNHNDE